MGIEIRNDPAFAPYGEAAFLGGATEQYNRDRQLNLEQDRANADVGMRLAQLYLGAQGQAFDQSRQTAQFGLDASKFGYQQQLDAAHLGMQQQEFLARQNPSNRDAWQAQQQDQQQQRHFQLQDALNRSQLNQGEQMRMQRMQQGLSSLDEMVQSGNYTEEDVRPLRVQLQTGLDPLHQRLAQSQMLTAELQRQQVQQNMRHQDELWQTQQDFRTDALIGGLRRIPDGQGGNLPGFWQMDQHGQLHQVDTEWQQQQHQAQIELMRSQTQQADAHADYYASLGERQGALRPEVRRNLMRDVTNDLNAEMRRLNDQIQATPPNLRAPLMQQLAQLQQTFGDRLFTEYNRRLGAIAQAQQQQPGGQGGNQGASFAGVRFAPAGDIQNPTPERQAYLNALGTAFNAPRQQVAAMPDNENRFQLEVDLSLLETLMRQFPSANAMPPSTQEQARQARARLVAARIPLPGG